MESIRIRRSSRQRKRPATKRWASDEGAAYDRSPGCSQRLGTPPAAVIETHDPPPVEGTGRSRGTRRRLLVPVLLVVAIVAACGVVIDPFDGGRGSSSGVSDNGFATSLATVTERALSAQTLVNGTLGYAGDWTIRVPAGIAPVAVAQARDSVSAAGRMLGSARSSLAADRVALADAQASLAADEQLLAVDCAGDGAAGTASGSTQSTGSTASTGAGGAACAGDAQLVAADQQAQLQATTKVNSDQGQVSAAARSLAAARAALASARTQETVYGQSSVFTGLPAAGRIVSRARELYAIDGQAVLLLYGSAVARRAFVPGMAPGSDVAELNANLDALGDGHDLAGDSFTAATAAAIRAMQLAHGLSPTGTLLLGSVVFAPGAVRVKSVTPSAGVGAGVTPGPLLAVSATRRVVTIALDTALEGQVQVGDRVIITLPDNTDTPGRVSYISKVAVTGQNGTTIAVNVTPSNPAATGTLDQAPVNVQITTASVSRALVVPVDALLALAGGGYAVEEVSSGAHHLVRASTGLFDDADGLVQITGAGLAAGQRVVVPGS